VDGRNVTDPAGGSRSAALTAMQLQEPSAHRHSIRDILALNEARTISISKSRAQLTVGAPMK
jgi:hypothetical protein